MSLYEARQCACMFLMWKYSVHLIECHAEKWPDLFFDCEITILFPLLCRIISGVPIFEISVKNADKPALSIEQIKSRLSQFEKEGIFSTYPACLFYAKHLE